MAINGTTRLKGVGIPGTSVEVASLWALVALELLTMVGLRRYFRRHHGG